MPALTLSRPITICLLYLLFAVQSFAQQKHQPAFLRASKAQKASRTKNLRDITKKTGDGSAGSVAIYTTGYANPGGDVTVTIDNNYFGVAPLFTGLIEMTYPKLVTYTTSSKAPVSNQPGKLLYSFSITNDGTSDITSTTFHIPMVGDSILSLGFSIQLKTTVADSADIYVQKRAAYVTITHPDPLPKGPTKGVKWLRTKTITSKELGDSAQGFSYLSAIDTSADGNYIFVAGHHQGNIYSNAGSVSANYIAKYTLDGLTIWEKFVPILVEEPGNASLKHTSDGGCIWVCDTSLYDPINYSYDPNSQGVLVKKWDANGNLSWKKFIRCPGGSVTFKNNVALLPNDDIVLVFESASHTGDIINNLPDSVGSSTVLMKLSATGNILWYKLFGGDGLIDFPYLVRIAKNGEILVAGATNSKTGSIAGYTGPKNDMFSDIYHQDAFVLKTDASGNLIWSKTFSLLHADYLTAMVETSNGFFFSGFNDYFDDSRTDSLKNGTSLWMLQLDFNGNKLQEIIKPVYPGYEQDRDLYNAMFCLEKSGDGNFITAGYSMDRYGYFKCYHGLSDIVIAKITPTGNILWQKQIGGTSWELSYAIQQDKKGDIIFVGETSSSDDDIYENNEPDGSMLIGKIGITNTISGKVFIDKNGNHIQDAGEALYNEGRIKTYKNGDTTLARIFGGKYLSNVDSGIYVTQYIGSNNYYDPFPVSKTTSFPSFDMEATVDIALIPKPGIKDLQTSITATTPARPGFDAGFRIITKNVGTETVANSVIKLAKSPKLTYLNASRATSSITADTISFAALNMTPGMIDTLDITVKLATPPTLNNGDTLTLTAIALPQVTDTTPANNRATLREVIRGSFDPNDKTEAHAGIYTQAMKAGAEPFQYLIRFQNTGTDTAFYVTVKDTLDSRVDVKTLETISSSHPYTFSVEGNIVTWQFNMIKLVDSITNEKKSHGYISFSIQPKDVLKIGDTVLNKAAIYFDYNLPVITNDAQLFYISNQSAKCPYRGDTYFYAGYTGISYQWQEDQGSGFVDMAPDGGAVIGTKTATLTIGSYIPTNYYGRLYRCAITLGASNKIYSEIYKLTFTNTWIGTVSTAWENAANWSCGSVPDANTDVIIKSTAIRQLEVTSTSATCRSITAYAAAHLWVKAGAKLTVTGK